MRARKAGQASSWATLAVISVTGALVAAFLFAQYAFEDAYITLRYAQNLGQGRGYVFNPGERVLGTSSPLWTLMLAAAGSVGANLELAKAVLSGVSLAALAFFGGLMLQREGAPRAGIVFALVVLFGFGRSFESWGMETPLFMALVFAALELLRSRRLLASGAVMGFAVLARHEGALFALPMTVYLLAEGSRHLHGRARGAMLFSLGALGVTLPWWLFAYSTFGTIFPHALEAKSMPFAPLAYLSAAASQFPAEWFWSDTQSSIRALLCAVILSLLAMGTAALWGRRSPMVAVAAGATLIFGGLCLIGPGYLFRWHRLPVHYALLGVTLLGASEAFRFVSSRTSLGALAAPGSVATATAAAMIALPFALTSHRAALTTSFAYQSRVVAYDGVIEFIRKANIQHLTLLAAEPGYVAYHTDNSVIDAAGLVSPSVSFGNDDRDPTTLGELLERRPGLILARAPFHPRGYRVILDLDHRCRLLLRSDHWTESLERLASR